MPPRSDAAGGESDHVTNLLEDLFETSTQEADLTDLREMLSDLYDAFNNQGFERSFKHVLRTILSESGRGVEVRRMLCFVSECAVMLDNKYKNDHKASEESQEDMDDVVVHPLLKYLFKALAQWSNASSYVIRSRSCQLLHMILTYIQDHGVGEIDMATYETISKIIEARRLDISCNVRTQAVLLAKFFQDPSSVNDPVIAGLCWQLEEDPNHRVRQNIVSIIAACEETIIPITKRFLFDKNAGVRNAALLHICNRISPRSFSAKQRIMILKQCFSDPSDLVRRNAEERLIPVWFRAYKDKLCRFFKDLRQGSESLDNLAFISKLMKVLSKCLKISEIIEEIDLDLESCLPKSNLTADKIFLWHRFYLLACKEDKLCRFLPQPPVLISFISKQFTSSSFEDDQSSVFNELSLFTIDIIAVAGAEECEEIFPVVLNMMRNPYVAHDVMPYIVTLYLRHTSKDKSIIYEEIMSTIEDLNKLIQFTPGEERNILLKSLSIISQVLLEADVITAEIMDMKDNLIVHHLSSNDIALKKKAIHALCLYCKLDKDEAKVSWPLFSNAVFVASSELKNYLLEGAFDILNCHGSDIFLNINDENKLDEAVENLFTHLEDDDKERNITVKGILKLYLSHHIWSPTILSKTILLYFNPEHYYSTMKDIEDFLKVYGKSRAEANCLCQTYLLVIDTIFDSNKNSPYHKVNVKKVVIQLLELGKLLGKSKETNQEGRFEDLVVLKLTKNFLKAPWRLSASDLYAICSLIIPKNVEILMELNDRIKLIIENLDSAVYQQTNPYTKKSIKLFQAYSKKIKAAISTAPLIPEASKQPSPLEKRLFANSMTDDSVNTSEEAELEIDSSSPFASEGPCEVEVHKENEGSSPLEEAQEAPLKTPAQIKTPGTGRRRMARKDISSRKTPLHGQMILSIDQSQFDIENVDSD